MIDIKYFPKLVCIEIVRGCNFQCKMCPVPINTKDDRQFEFMDLELLRHCVEQLDKYSTIENIWFFGFGEPLAHPKFRECLEILYRSKVAQEKMVYLCTNASLLAGDKAEALLDIPVIKKLAFSFHGHGDKKSYEAFSGPNYDKVLKNITAFAKKAIIRRPDMQLATTTILPRVGEVLGLEMIDDNIATNQLQQLFSPLNITPKTRRSHDYSGNEQLNISGKRPANIFGGCPFIENDTLNITVDGDATPCCAVYNKEFNIGSIRNNELFELMNNVSMKDFRHNLRLDKRSFNKYCQNCAISLGNQNDKNALNQFWKIRDRQGMLDDPCERKYIINNFVDSGPDTIRLDLGAGINTHAGFIGVDRFPMKNISVITDLNGNLPFTDNSIDMVYASHFLEHVDDLHKILKEIVRVCHHLSEICIVAPYYQQTLNFANIYHKQAFNEHTPRFWTTTPINKYIPDLDYSHHITPQWGLEDSDYSAADFDIRCVRMEFFYFPEYQNKSESEKRTARQHYFDVCDQIMYHLLVVKKPILEEEMEDRIKKMEYYEPDYITVRRYKERSDILEDENKNQQTLIQSLVEEKKTLLEYKNRSILLVNELENLKNRRIFKLYNRVFDRSNAARMLSPKGQQLLDDSILFNKDINTYVLQPSENISKNHSLFFPISVDRTNLHGIILAPLVYFQYEDGVMGIEILTKDKKHIVRICKMQIKTFDGNSPVEFNFEQLETPISGWIRVFVENTDLPVRLFVWKKYFLCGLISVQDKVFCSYKFGN